MFWNCKVVYADPLQTFPVIALGLWETGFLDLNFEDLMDRVDLAGNPWKHLDFHFLAMFGAA